MTDLHCSNDTCSATLDACNHGPIGPQLRAAGWHIIDGLTYCPRCHTGDIHTVTAMTRDTPPGHRRFKLGSWEPQPMVPYDHPDYAIVPWCGEPGDVIVEYGQRLGERFWIVVDVEPLRKWATVLVRPARRDEALVAADEADGHGWLITARTIRELNDTRSVCL